MEHKILIVDDEASIRLILKEAFAGAYEVLTASEGLAAVELIKRERPALVFLDIKMPGISGLEVLRLVRDAGSSSVVWMLTGEDDLEVALGTLKMGAAGYLTKPFDVEKVRDIARSIVDAGDRKAAHDTRDDKPWKVERKAEKKRKS